MQANRERKLVRRLAIIAGLTMAATAEPAIAKSPFEDQVAPILARRCFSCHNDRDQNGEFSLETAKAALESGHIEAGNVEDSVLIDAITPNAVGRAKMPKNADPLSKAERAVIRKWIADGAVWPKEFRIKAPEVTDTDWWSLRPIKKPALPKLSGNDAKWTRTPVDAFVVAKHRKLGLAPAREANRRTLIRRLYYDLLGLPPAPADVDAFVNDNTAHAYENIVDRLLASPQYGERWARHWLDVVHYGDTHGYDKDKLRRNAWPYRDYVIRSFNNDTPYSRFVKEQLAGDVLYPKEPRLIAATGFVVAGPWDFIGHVEVPATKKDGRIARHLDRDDMVVNTIQTFCSMTVACARCHNHKFDPVTQEDYYSLQAVFAAVGRNDRPMATNQKMNQLLAKRSEIEKRSKEISDQIDAKVSDAVGELDSQVVTFRKKLKKAQLRGARSPRYGYHSQLAPAQEVEKWVQVDLGREVKIDRILLVGADEYGFADFGFPHRFKVDVSSDAFRTKKTLADHTAADYARPGAVPVEVNGRGMTARYVRITGTKLWSRRHRGQPKTSDWIFAIGEMAVLSNGKNVAINTKVTALDSIQAPVRWSRKNLTDGIFGKYPYSATAINEITAASKQLSSLRKQRANIVARLVPKELSAQLARAKTESAAIDKDIATLPAKQKVYAVATHFKPQGGHQPSNGKPKPIYVLKRGVIDAHMRQVVPGTLRLPNAPPARFNLPDDHAEGARRVALAEWIVDKQNPLTWRSIVNRMWHYHFGQGICASPNDLGRMGAKPTHPQLLDWLAAEFRDGGKWITRPQSIKQLHRLIVTSAVYRQATAHNDKHAAIDGGNRYLWRFNRRRLEAEAIRDTTLLVAGKLNHKMYGPGFRDFVIEQSAHSPQFVYEKYNPDDASTHRRSVYRFLPRSQPQPFMETLDCADPSQQVAKRDETITALSALALLNNKFMVRMAEHFAARLERDYDTREKQIDAALRFALGRSSTSKERTALVEHARKHGLASSCRVIMNLNEFVFVD